MIFPFTVPKGTKHKPFTHKFHFADNPELPEDEKCRRAKHKKAVKKMRLARKRRGYRF